MDKVLCPFVLSVQFEQMLALMFEPIFIQHEFMAEHPLALALFVFNAQGVEALFRLIYTCTNLLFCTDGLKQFLLRLIFKALTMVKHNLQFKRSHSKYLSPLNLCSG